MKYEVLVGDCLVSLRNLPDQSVHTCVTSPPYFGLRDYGHDGQIGLEDTPDAFVERLVDVFREVRRVLRDDGTLWLNLGDSYAANRSYQVNSTKGGLKHGPGQSAGGKASKVPSGLKPKDLIGIPWRVAFALQADGWYLRQDIIWHKPNPMPESVRDRCTKAHEYIFMLSKSPKYYFDSDAAKEPAVGNPSGNKLRKSRPTQQALRRGDQCGSVPWEGGAERNRRSVWSVTTKPFKGAHFATFPPDLIEPCILAGAPERCCSNCGAPSQRQTSRETTFEGGSGKAGRTSDEVNSSGKWAGKQYGTNLKLGPTVRTTTIGWKPTCECAAYHVGGTVLDPFGGSGTTAGVALLHGRNAILCELNPEYAALVDNRVRSIANIETPKLSAFGTWITAA